MTSAIQEGRDRGGYLSRPSSSSLADVVEMILDKGLVIDAYVRVSLVGIELITIDARIVIASVDTYLRFAEATNRLDLYEHGGKSIDELGGSLMQSGASGKTKGVLDGAKEKFSELLSGSDDDDEDEDYDEDDDYEDEEDEEEPEPVRSRSGSGRRQPARRGGGR
jgi:gas vesicle structural protein